jgi:3-hydroxyacyl-[acyl-carrier-protein] dehydratase
MHLTQDEIKNIIPHREPFILIDEITELIPGESATAVKYVSENEFWVKGHFPSNPVMPGVLIIEALAQAGAVAVLGMSEYKGKTAYFGGIKDAKFKKMVKPGDTLLLETKITNIRGPIGVAECRATVDGQVAATCTLTFVIPE